MSQRLLCDSNSASSSFFFNDTATTEIYTLSLHDALPISLPRSGEACTLHTYLVVKEDSWQLFGFVNGRSEEHTSELQSLRHLVCRLLLEKKKRAALESTIEDSYEVIRDFNTIRVIGRDAS